MTDAPEWHKRRVAGMPETIFVSEARVQPDGFDARRYNYTAAVQYVRADLLEAAQARIAELEAEVSAWRQVRDAVAELEGLGPDWPSHGNAPLAVTSGYALHRQRAATARAEALEEAERACTCKICAGTIRALKEKPNG